MKPYCKLIPDFIIPNLECGKYGRHLMWEDKKKGSFKVSRVHQSSDEWNEDCIDVYKAWSIKKHLWKPEDPKRVTKAKHRLITALRRNPVIQMLQKEPAYYRFQLIDSNHTDSDEDSDTEHTPSIQEEFNHIVNIDGRSLSTINENQTRQESIHHEDKLKQITNDKVPCAVCVQTPDTASKAERFFIPLAPSEMFPEMYPLTDDVSNLSGKCCCDILLDSTLLFNETCIWHGIPP